MSEQYIHKVNIRSRLPAGCPFMVPQWYKYSSGCHSEKHPRTFSPNPASPLGQVGITSLVQPELKQQTPTTAKGPTCTTSHSSATHQSLQCCLAVCALHCRHFWFSWTIRLMSNGRKVMERGLNRSDLCMFTVRTNCDQPLCDFSLTPFALSLAI